VYVLPPMLSGREPARRIARLEALEQWARRLGRVSEVVRICCGGVSVIHKQ
jgi:hypothetical protein